jgi:hypothetical protein
MESRFEQYENSERENLFVCFGGDLALLEKVGGKVGDHDRHNTRLRRFFEKLNLKRRQEGGLGCEFCKGQNRSSNHVS